MLLTAPAHCLASPVALTLQPAADAPKRPRRSRGALLALVPALLAVAPHVWAQDAVPQVSSRMFVEAPGRLDRPAGTRLFPAPDRLNRGDRLIVLVQFQVHAERSSVVVTSPIPSGLRFDGASSGAELSVDDGRRFRPGAAMLAGDGTALNAVTHVRWRVRAEDGARGALSFRGVVR